VKERNRKRTNRKIKIKIPEKQPENIKDLKKTYQTRKT
jgi:hypothetical protein